jgi:hypothetical protein
LHEEGLEHCAWTDFGGVRETPRKTRMQPRIMMMNGVFADFIIKAPENHLKRRMGYLNGFSNQRSCPEIKVSCLKIAIWIENGSPLSRSCG